LNVPPSILRKEILPAIAKTATIWLNTIWNGWKPCATKARPQNALGQVKFVFQTHIIYMHDTHQNSI
jgi:murein L,D-transpeptidase YcbB/YkuD